MKVRAFRNYNDPKDPHTRIFVDEVDGWGSLKVVTAKMTSDSPTAEVITVYESVELYQEDAEWLLSELTRWLDEKRIEALEKSK